MKHHISTYNLARNIFSGKLYIKQKSPSEAMALFFDWLEEQPAWVQLWRIDVELEEIQSSEPE